MDSDYWNTDNLSNRKSWDRIDTPRLDTACYTFTAKRNQTYGFRYAPITNGSLYIKVPTNRDKAKLFGKNVKNDIYVSILLLLGMGSQDFSGRSDERELNLNGILDPMINDPNNDQFISNLESKPAPSRLLDYSNRAIKFPVRDSSGMSDWAYLSHEGSLTEWDKFRNQLITESYASNGKPPRHVNLPLKQPLKVMLLQTRESLLLDRISSNKEHIYDWFSLLVDQVNDANPGALELVTKEPAGHILIAKDPFEIYSTWIHQQDWNDYMRKLGIHPFPRNDADVLRGLLKTLSDRATVLLANRPSHELMYDFNLQPEEVREIFEERAAIATRGREMSQENQERAYASMLAMYRQARVNGPGKLTNMLDARKIHAAVGKRKEERGQAAVMGNYSATEIAGAFDLPMGKLATGFSVAEWLHLSAYSWGGFEDEGHYLTSSSQSPENLVFGSSETNSLMTRYEVAWQRLLREEQDILDCGHAYSIGNLKTYAEATLDITVNDPKVEIPYDVTDGNGNFSLLPLKFEQDEIDYRTNHPRASLTDYSDGDSHPIYQRPDKSPSTQRRMLRLANCYSWIAYSIEYSVKLDTPSYILGTNDVAHTLHHFFPFQRPFFHTAESDLDDLVWKDLTNLGWLVMFDAIRNTHGDIGIEEPSDPDYRELVWSDRIKEKIKLGFNPVTTKKEQQAKEKSDVTKTKRDIQERTIKESRKARLDDYLGKRRDKLLDEFSGDT